MKVEIYDQYSNVYSDALNNGKFTMLNLGYKEVLDEDRYTLVHASTGFSKVVGDNLSKEDAINLVTSLYLESKNLGKSCDDKL